MPITVTCTCGKRFGTAEGNAGKKARCPGCATVIVIPSGTSTADTGAAASEGDDIFSLSEPEKFATTVAAAPGARSVARAPSVSKIAPPVGTRDRRRQPTRVPSFMLSPLYIAMIAAAITIPAILFWIRQGPLRAQRQWSAMSQSAEDGITSLTLRAMNHQYAQMGININDPTNLHPHPKVTSFSFDEPIIMLSLPETITFQGNTTEGLLHGTFHPRTLRFEADVEVERATHRLTGSINPTTNTFEFDGHPVAE